VIDVPLVRVAVGAIFDQIALVAIDVALIGIAIGAVLRQIFLIVSNVFLVALNVLLLRSWIRALGIRTTGEQTGKSNREHTSTDRMFCVHRVLSYEKSSWTHHHTYQIKHQPRSKVSRRRAGNFIDRWKDVRNVDLTTVVSMTCE